MVVDDKPVGCSTTCVVADPDGMPPHGGCYCLDDIKDPIERARLKSAFSWYRAEIRRLEHRFTDFLNATADERQRGKAAIEMMARLGYRYCDIPMCNCGSYHEGIEKSIDDDR